MKFYFFALCGLALTLGFSSCSMFTKKIQLVNDRFPDFSAEAHRGGRGLYPENTIEAMKMTIEHMPHITTLEMDCHITADKKVVVTHDDYLNPKYIRYADGKDIPADKKDLKIYKFDYNELKTYDTGSKLYSDFPDQLKLKTHIPLLSELIDAAEAEAKLHRKSPMFYNIETKSSPKGDNILHPQPSTFVDLMVEVIMNKGIGSRTVIQSFDKRTIQYLNKMYPQLKSSYLIDGNNKQTVEELIKDLGFTPFIISPNYSLVTKEFVADCHARGIKVIPWTANTKDEIKRLKKLKVDGIISDYPNLL